MDNCVSCVTPLIDDSPVVNLLTNDPPTNNPTTDKQIVVIHKNNGSTIYKITDNGTTAIVKRVKKGIFDIEPIILCKIKHPNIIPMLSYWDDEKFHYMTLPFADQSDLFEYVYGQSLMSEKRVRMIFSQIVAAVAYAHQNGICHRDIKPENILVYNNGMKIVLSDWGLAHDFSTQDETNKNCGSPYYAAPEIIGGYYYKGPEIDVWSLGVTLYVLLTQKLPFPSKNLRELYKSIFEGQYIRYKHFSMNVEDLLDGMICVNPLLRFSIDKVLAHPWLRSDCLKNIR